jgi:mono/diheme cytochrome c family protein
VKSTIFLLLTCATLLAVSEGLASGQKDWNGKTDVYAELNKAPEKARDRANPLESDPDAVTAGRLLFEDYCAECHGDNAEGGKRAPSLRALEVQNAAPGAIFWVLTNGVVRKGMPVWSRLPEPQRWQLVRYLKSLGGVARLPNS